MLPLIAPYGEAEVFPDPYAPWSANHIFGTDQIGRDIFSRLIFGARNTVGVAFATTILAFLIGGALGLAAAINRSYLDLLLSRTVDVLMAIPQLIFDIGFIIHLRVYNYKPNHNNRGVGFYARLSPYESSFS